MPPPLPDPGSVRPVADINDDIRALWAANVGGLDEEQRAEYSRLLAEYAAAVAARAVKVA